MLVQVAVVVVKRPVPHSSMVAMVATSVEVEAVVVASRASMALVETVVLVVTVTHCLSGCEPRSCSSRFQRP